MLPDRFFYPLAAMIIAGMILFALSLGGGDALTDEQIMKEGWTVSGADLQGLTISPGSNGAYLPEDGGFMRLSQFTPMGQGPASIGVFGTLGPDHERAFAGQTLQVTIRARAAASDPLEAFMSAYYPMESQPSGWQTFDLTTDWQDFSFTFSPPIVDARPNVDLIAIFPGQQGEQKVMDLQSIRIEPVQ